MADRTEDLSEDHEDEILPEWMSVPEIRRRIQSRQIGTILDWMIKQSESFHKTLEDLKEESERCREQARKNPQTQNLPNGHTRQQQEQPQQQPQQLDDCLDSDAMPGDSADMDQDFSEDPQSQGHWYRLTDLEPMVDKIELWQLGMKNFRQATIDEEEERAARLRRQLEVAVMRHSLRTHADLYVDQNIFFEFFLAHVLPALNELGREDYSTSGGFRMAMVRNGMRDSPSIVWDSLYRSQLQARTGMGYFGGARHMLALPKFTADELRPL